MVKVAGLTPALILAGFSLPLAMLITLPKLRAMDRRLQAASTGRA
jgi:hypothetical protein